MGVLAAARTPMHLGVTEPVTLPPPQGAALHLKGKGDEGADRGKRTGVEGEKGEKGRERGSQA